MERARELAQTFLSFYILSHALPGILILILIIYSLWYVRKRPSIKVEPFIIGFICLLFLMGFNLFRDIIQLWSPAVYGFALVDLLTICAVFYTFYTFLDFVPVARKYLTPADVANIRSEHHQAFLYNQLHIQSNWLNHTDMEVITMGLAREIDDGDRDRLRQISQRLHKFAEFGTGELAEQYSLADALEWAKEALASEISSVNLEIHDEELPSVSCYPNQMNWLFREIISNVLKHNKEDNPSLSIFSEELLHDWLITFEDNGEGIIYRDQDQIFNLFRMDQNERIDLNKGMGLALCRKIMRIHRGHIWMESDYYAGVTIYLSIPKQLVLKPRKMPEY